MPQLITQNIKQLRIEDPVLVAAGETDDDPYILTIDASPYGGLVEDMFAVVNGAMVMRPNTGPLVNVIKSWNVTDEAGKIAPINVESLRRLPAHVLTQVSNAISLQVGVELEAEPIGKAEKKV